MAEVQPPLLQEQGAYDWGYWNIFPFLSAHVSQFLIFLPDLLRLVLLAQNYGPSLIKHLRAIL